MHSNKFKYKTATNKILNFFKVEVKSNPDLITPVVEFILPFSDVAVCSQTLIPIRRIIGD